MLSRPQRWIVPPAQHQCNFGLDRPWCFSSWKTWSGSFFSSFRWRKILRYLWRGQHLWNVIFFPSSWGTCPKLPPQAGCQNSMDGMPSGVPIASLWQRVTINHESVVDWYQIKDFWIFSDVQSSAKMQAMAGKKHISWIQVLQMLLLFKDVTVSANFQKYPYSNVLNTVFFFASSVFLGSMLLLLLFKDVRESQSGLSLEVVVRLWASKDFPQKGQEIDKTSHLRCLVCKCLPTVRLHGGMTSSYIGNPAGPGCCRNLPKVVLVQGNMGLCGYAMVPFAEQAREFTIITIMHE